jgi:hypothetical protein
MPDFILPRPGSSSGPAARPAAQRDWVGPAAAIATLGVHLLILGWLLAPRARAPSSPPLQVEWIRAETQAPVPPMPVAPPRPPRSTRAFAPTAAPTAEPQSPAATDADAELVDIEPVVIEPGTAPAGEALYGQIEGFVRSREPLVLGPNDPLERRQRLPGRAEPIVEGIRLRVQRSPADWVAIVGGLFGATGGATCGDIRRKIASDISDAERMKLIHDERAICRRGEAGTYRH